VSASKASDQVAASLPEVPSAPVEEATATRSKKKQKLHEKLLAESNELLEWMENKGEFLERQRQTESLRHVIAVVC
jgi:hypothetical protein